MDSFQVFFNKQLIYEEGGLNSKLLPLILERGFKKVVVVVGASVAHLEPVVEFLAKLQDKIDVQQILTSGEPKVEVVQQNIDEARQFNPDLVIGIGGGSTLDVAKAISFMVKEEGALVDFLEGIGTKKPSGQKIPFYAVPTTAGTGSEATKNGVITAVIDGKTFKKSFRHENFPADVALLDPQLTLRLPADLTAACGMDAITQLLEAFVSTADNAVTHALAESGLAKAGDALDLSFSYGDDPAARGDLLYAAYLSGICLANADLGAVHGIAGPLGALIPISHGKACAILLPYVTDAVIRQLVTHAHLGSDSFKYLVCYARAGYLINNELETHFDIAEGCRKLIDKLQFWKETFAFGTLADYGMKPEMVELLATQSKSRKSPVQFTTDELANIIREASGFPTVSLVEDEECEDDCCCGHDHDTGCESESCWPDEEDDCSCGHHHHH